MKNGLQILEKFKKKYSHYKSHRTFCRHHIYYEILSNLHDKHVVRIGNLMIYFKEMKYGMTITPAWAVYNTDILTAIIPL